MCRCACVSMSVYVHMRVYVCVRACVYTSVWYAVFTASSCRRQCRRLAWRMRTACSRQTAISSRSITSCSTSRFETQTSVWARCRILLVTSASVAMSTFLTLTVDNCPQQTVFPRFGHPRNPRFQLEQWRVRPQQRLHCGVFRIILYFDCFELHCTSSPIETATPIL